MNINIFAHFVTLAVFSGPRVVDGYVRVGPNRWSRRSDVRNDAV